MFYSRLHDTKSFALRAIRAILPILAISLVSSEHTCAAPQVEAVAGEPFGVGKVTIDVLRGEPSIPLSDERFTIWQEASRAMYPVVKQEPAKRLLRRVLSIESPRKVTVYFLFQGNEPFDLSVFSPIEQAVRIQPQINPERHRNMLNDWWQAYSGRWNTLCSDPQFPPMAENFLVASLGRRLNLDLAASERGLLKKKRGKTTALGELFASESHLLKLDREKILNPTIPTEERVPLPATPVWEDLAIDDMQFVDVAIEPIATRVPEECFYLRFGKFLNYLWFRDLSEKWQGDLQNMVLRRAVDRAADQRTQQQLSLKYNAMAKILGPQVVEDLAIVGLDTNTTQGAAIGVLMHAKNNFLLSQDMMRQRRRSLSTFSDAKETTVKIAEQEVSLIATPGGEVRSYYVQQGDFHLVSTSATLVERFIEAGQGDRAIAALPSFLQARKQLTIAQDDTVFVFVPEKFFENLCSPHYFIENARRISSAREPLLLELASLTAETENSLDVDLMTSGILPAGFGTRVDGSQLDVIDDKLTDSRRGTPGYFVPIADMQVEDVSQEEASAYQDFITRFRSEIGRMPPVAVAVKRQPVVGDQVTISFDALVQPTTGTKVEDLKEYLGEASSQRLQPVEGNIASLEAAVKMKLPFGDGTEKAFHLFGGLRDYLSPLAVKQGKLMPGSGLTELVRGYVGAWPRPGLLDSLLGGTQPVPGEPQRVNQPLVGDIWLDSEDDLAVISFKPEVIDQVRPQLAKTEADRPAQVWMSIEDLTGKQFAGTVSALGYMRARETSVAASRMMNSLANQFRIGRPECRDLAERLVDGTFVCPLGGEYQLLAPERDLEVWASSAVTPENRFLLTEVPEDFQLPLLQWFRGVNGDLSYVEDALSIHLELNLAADSVPQ